MSPICWSRVPGLLVSRVAGLGPEAIEFLTEAGTLWLFDARLVDALVDAMVRGSRAQLVHDALEAVLED